MGPKQTYRLLHSKGNHKQNKKTTYEKIFANEATDKGLISKNIQAAHAAQYDKKKQPDPKMGRRPK